MGSLATAAMPVLVWYRLAYTCRYSDETKTVVRTKMVHAASSRTLRRELDAALVAAKAAGEFKDVEGEVRSWGLVRYMPYSQEANF